MSRLRSLALPGVVFAYVAAAAHGAGAGWLPWLAAAVALAGVLALERRTAQWAGSPERDAAHGRAVRAVGFGGALHLLARLGPPGDPTLDAAACAGAGVAGVGACLALARVSGRGGLLQSPRTATSLDAAGLVAFAWSVAGALPAARWLLPAGTVAVDPQATDLAITSAGVATLLVLLAAALRMRATRRLELGVVDRANGALVAAGTALLSAASATLLGVGLADRTLPAAAVATAAATAWVMTTAEPTRVARATRALLALALIGAPTAITATVAVQAYPDRAPAIVLLTTAAAAAIGLVARAVARPLGPDGSRWLEAIDAASQAVLQPEPEPALRAALAALDRASRVPGARPELVHLSPAQALSVDVAGYLHTAPVDVPPAAIELARGEPERTLRAEVLRAVEVRQPAVRPLLAWLETRGAFTATLIDDDDGPVGLLLMPRAGRSDTLALEEARALRLLADRVSALLAVAAALARARARQLDTDAAVRRLESEGAALSARLASAHARLAADADTLARRVRTSAFGGASRVALDTV
ncbi:MAG: hypothetical protein IT376_16945, partial [Polyangiaceae bacterium]|nr:hypothetical protein [Polyangiaceae bacterium]